MSKGPFNIPVRQISVTLASALATNGTVALPAYTTYGGGADVATSYDSTGAQMAVQSTNSVYTDTDALGTAAAPAISVSYGSTFATVTYIGASTLPVGTVLLFTLPLVGAAGMTVPYTYTAPTGGSVIDVQSRASMAQLNTILSDIWAVLKTRGFIS